MSNPYTPENLIATSKGGHSVFGLHPLVAAAAVSVIALSGVGIATMLMNRSSATTAPDQAVATAPMTDVANSTTAESSVPATPIYEAPVSKPASKPTVKPASRPIHKPTQVAAAESLPVTQPATPVYDAPVAQAPAPCRECAVVESTREVKVEGKGSGLGAVAGGLVGGLLGNRVGAGNGRALATIAGAVGGGYAGNAIEKSSKAGIQYEMVVRFEDGTTQKFTRINPWPYGNGDKVKVVDNQVVSG